MLTMDNPLLNQGPLPTFSNILPEQIEPAIRHVISQNRAELHALLTSGQDLTWEKLFLPLEDMADRLSKVWSPVSHLHSVLETEPLRAAYNACLPLLTDYHTELMQNEVLFGALKAIEDSPEYSQLTDVQRRVLDNELRDFRLAGVGLPPPAKARFADLQKKLTQLTTQFSENVLDATNAWALHVTDVNALAGLPESAIKIAEQNAQQRGETGWTFTLDYPCYAAVMKYLANRELRWLMHEAYVTRASDEGPHAGRWDNTQVMEDILKTRHELAILLGFKNYADYSLATKMAKKPQKVLHFLDDLVKRSKGYGDRDIKELVEFAKTLDGIEKLESWDIPYYTEKLRQKNYSLSQEDVRPYFPVSKVLDGMFAVVNKVFGLKITEQKNIDTWHPHVQYFEVYDSNGELRGSFYTDLYARANKRDGAWMDEARVRRRMSDGHIQLPVAYLTCNFTRPLGNKASYLTHDEVQTVFHEFGHCLHHLLTKVDYLSVSGINGVPWDAIEFPSQFVENWCWDKETLQLISEHETTGEILPDTLYNKLIAAKNFQPGMHILRQLEFALFDFRLHLEFNPEKGPQVQTILNDVRSKVAVVPFPVFNRFQHSFSHIFAGGYAAGYYSYEWAQVLSSDAFSRFEEEGIYNAQVGKAFMENILEKGGTHDPMDLFIAFRGREPKIDALLRHSGL
jgi:oligopeptidase A